MSPRQIQRAGQLLAIHSFLDRRAAALGFSRWKKSSVYLRQVDSGLNWHLSLSAERDDEDGLAIIVYIGVKHEKISRLWQQASGSKWSIHGSVINGCLEWLVPEEYPSRHAVSGGIYKVQWGDGAESFAAEVEDHFRRFGLPYLEPIKSMGSLIDALRPGGRTAFTMNAMVNWPLALLCAGRYEEAIAAVEEEMGQGSRRRRPIDLETERRLLETIERARNGF